MDGNPKGRFPANILDEQSGILKSGAMKKEYTYTNNGYSLGKPSGKTKSIHESNQGGASRFFYCAKSSKSERNKGLEDKKLQNNHPTVKPISLIQYLVRLVTPPNGTCLDPFCESGTTGLACELENINAICIDITPEYIDISKARHNAYKNIPVKSNPEKYYQILLF